MKLRNLIGGIVAALAVCQAFAYTSDNLGNIPVGTSKSFDGVIGLADNELDKVIFNLSSPSQIGGFGGSFLFSFGPQPGYSPVGFTFTLDGTLITLTNNAFTSVLSGGNHTLDIGGANGALYFGTITNLAAVPEPGSLAMLLAGLGIMGVVVRRRGTAN